MQTSTTPDSYQVPSDALADAFERQMALCDVLESIADSLPGRLDRQQCLHTARLMGPLFRQAHDAEEALLFPRLAAALGDPSLIDKLRLEHIEDESFAEEVQYELLELGKGRSVLAPEATGYMLRGFFEGVRRHIRHERELLSQLGTRRTE